MKQEKENVTGKFIVSIYNSSVFSMIMQKYLWGGIER